MLNLNIENLNGYLDSLDKKNLIMLYSGILILFFIIGNFIYSNYILEEKVKLDAKKKEILKKLSEVRGYRSVIDRDRKKYLKQKSLLASLEEDLKYLNSVIVTSKRLYIDKKKFLDILNNYLKIGAYLDASFELNTSKSLSKYNLVISGNFNSDKYLEFVNFLRVIESAKAIITINKCSLKEEKNRVYYNLKVSIWSIK